MGQFFCRLHPYSGPENTGAKQYYDKMHLDSESIISLLQHIKIPAWTYLQSYRKEHLKLRPVLSDFP